MHDLGDLILEAVVNSEEAGADSVSITLNQIGETIEVRVADDGSLKDAGCLFDEGFSTKGNCRGRGLSLIKHADENASLKRVDGKSVLTFKTRDDGSLDKLEDVLFPIFQRLDRTKFLYIKDGKTVLDLERNGERLDTIKDIALFKNIVKTRKGVKDV